MIERSTGFGAVVGNPPFLGGKRTSTCLGERYSAWLKESHQGASNNVDLSAFFVRRSHELLQRGGTLGLIATSTIAEGDTRSGGLGWLTRSGAKIFAATRRLRWPGEASVIVSVIHLAKGRVEEPCVLDGVPVERITAFLFSRGTDDDPVRLHAVPKKAFIGAFLRGMGFTFDDRSEEATPIRTLQTLRSTRPEIDEVVRPYLGGEEVLTDPEQRASRFAIDLRGLSEHSARSRYPELMAIVERKVRPFREGLKERGVDGQHRQKWWLFANHRPELFDCIRGLPRVFVLPRVSTHFVLAALEPAQIFSDQLVVMAFSSWAAFALLQSGVHELWARSFSSTMGEGLRYAPSDAFETFPWPEGWEENRALESVGAEYHQHRAAILRRRAEGLTKTYNRFHDPADDSLEMEGLRAVRRKLEDQVFRAYGFADLSAQRAFVSVDDKVRYEFTEDVRDELLVRLLQLNRLRSISGFGSAARGA